LAVRLEEPGGPAMSHNVKMLSKLVVFLSCAMVAAAAQTLPQKVFPYAFSQDDLPNGLRVVTVPTDYPNIVAVYIVVQTGSRNELEQGHTGFAHLFEHLMFKGTEKHSQQQYNDAIKRMGGASNAFTTDDYTCFTTVFSKEDLPTVVAMEADRFQNLKYSEADFKTETLAVLGEYNKNASSPFSKLNEVLLDTAYTTHTYKHTTMGFLKDVQDMPNQYEYSQKFFSRYYRPEYVTIVVAGDLKAKAVRDLVAKEWGAWKRGSYKPEIPVEPVQDAPRTNHVDWTGPTLPLLAIAYKGPAYDDSTKDTAALDALSYLAFSENSELYQRLIIQEQKADALFASPPKQVDPSLFQILARVKKADDMDYVREQILAAVQQFREKPVDDVRLDTVRRHLRYALALRMDNNETIAQVVAGYVALRRTPETMNKLYEQYARLTPQDVQQAATKYLMENARTIVTLDSVEVAK
jgi:zinc protease